ncbi:hypothetical protein IW261DRAFT_1506864 [Armillaria novae-zelandiae]|uniref:Uncharacterized protein n=1 Tax=Armillaria novae-zelandiae TaxID=153914 RepID=A0AA39NVT4_9AGAR|nr:hypothetical protein IW261DRAFT_1506864 [Armillaria novae-zelandiae]
MHLYHTPEAALILKEILPVGNQYHASESSEPVFSVLWQNYRLCQFVEDHDEVAYYKIDHRWGQNRFSDGFVAHSRGLNARG